MNIKNFIKFRKGHKEGISVIEIIVVVVIILIISSSVAVSIFNFRKNHSLNNSVEIIKTAMQEAQERTIASEESSQYGAHFDADKVVVFRGTTYSPSDTSNVAFSIPGETEISSISLAGGGSNMIFEKITGKTNQYGTITVRLKVDNTLGKVLTVSSSFAISVQ